MAIRFRSPRPLARIVSAGVFITSLWLSNTGHMNAQALDTAILGTVLDPSGEAVSGASVTVTATQTGIARTLSTRADGRYECRYLVPGEYSLEVSATGFRVERRTAIVLQIGQEARIDFALQIGSVQETVEVHAASPILQTENATLGEVVGSERILNLPLNGRNFAMLAVLTPGVQVQNISTYPGTQFITDGNRNTWNSVTFDGVNVMNPRSDYVNIFPSLDVVQEFKVQSSNYSAEYGGNAGSNISLQIRSGTNGLHGSAFDFLRNRELDARNYFRSAPLEKDNLRRNQFGANLLGPVRKNKTFFMVAYEGMRYTQQSPSFGSVITPAERQGDFSAVSTRIVDPLGGAPFPGQIIPANRLNSVSVNLVNQYMPLPNQSGSLNFAGVSRTDTNQDQALGRVDYYIGPRDQFFVHYIYQGTSFPLYALDPRFVADRNARSQNVAFQYVHIFSPTFLNEVRVGYQRANRTQFSLLANTNFTAESIGINGLSAIAGPNGRKLSGIEIGFPPITIQGYVGMGDSNVGGFELDFSRTPQFVDNVTVIRGNHAMKFGADLRRLMDNASTSNYPFGEIDFTSDIGGEPAAAYMLGYPHTVETPEGIPVSAIRQWQLGVYFQDDWKVTSKLTMNLGVRYDLISVPKDVNGNSRTLRFDLGTPGPVLWPAPGQVVNDLYLNDYKHISPRIGLAYRATPRTVVRAGYGIFQGANVFDNICILQLNPPSAASLTVINNSINPTATIQNPVPPQLLPGNPLYNVVSLEPDRHHHNGYMQNWNFTIGQELSTYDSLEIGYVGSKGTHLDTGITNFNSPQPGPGDIQSRRPYPQFGRIRMEASDSNSIYNAFQAHYEHRFYKGLSLTAAYSWSHMIDNNDSVHWGACYCQNPLDHGSPERASSRWDLRHNFTAGYVWQLPFGSRGGGVPAALVKGWSLGGIVTLRSGGPVNVTQSGDTQNDDNTGWSRPNLVPGQQVQLSNPDRSMWFNTGAFSRSVLQYGNTPRMVLTGPPTYNFDLSASRSFKMPFRESHQLLFRAEFFNAFNTPNFANPGGVLGTSSFGVVTSTNGNNRQIQFSLKYMF